MGWFYEGPKNPVTCPKCGEKNPAKIKLNASFEYNCASCGHWWGHDHQLGERPTGTRPPEDWDGSSFTSEDKDFKVHKNDGTPAGFAVVFFVVLILVFLLFQAIGG
jgi:hypothetical protein